MTHGLDPQVEKRGGGGWGRTLVGRVIAKGAGICGRKRFRKRYGSNS